MTWKLPNDIDEKAYACKLRIEAGEALFSNKLDDQMGELETEKLEILKDFDLVQRYEDLSKYEDACKQSEALQYKIEDALEKADVVKRRQVIFKQKPVDYSSLDKLQKEFAPHLQLWQAARYYYDHSRLWMNGSISDELMSTLSQDIQQYSSAVGKLQKKDFRDKAETAAIANDLRKLYESFRPYLPLVVALKNKHMVSRHFQDIRNLREP